MEEDDPYEMYIEENLSTYNEDTELYTGRRVYKGQCGNCGKYGHHISK